MSESSSTLPRAVALKKSPQMRNLTKTSTRPESTIRQAKRRDCGAIAKLAGQLGYRCTSSQIGARLEEMNDSADYAVFVAELASGRIAGWIGAYLFRSVETGSWAEVNGLVVDHQLRSRGIGKTLLEAAEAWARNIGCSTISVRSNVVRARAHRFYERNAYAHVKTQKEFHKGL